MHPEATTRPTLNDRLRQTAVPILALSNLAASAWLGDSLDQAPGDAAPVYFLPAGYAFAVWGLIFTTALIYAGYQAWKGQAVRTVHRRIGWWVAANAALTTLWMILAGLAGSEGSPTFRPELVAATSVVLVAMLACTTAIVVALRDLHSSLLPRDRWLVQFPTTVFFAWLNVAAIANTTAALDAYGITGGTAGSIWAVALTLVATLLASGMILYFRSRIALWSYVGVIVWALVAIAVAQGERSPLLAGVALAASAWLLGLAAWRGGA